VGVQLPFDRLIHAMDQWAADSHCDDVFAQVGRSTYKPQHLTFKSFISPAEFRQLVERADVVVAHAGMGTILTASELGKPILVMPRRAALGEHRNDHQLATIAGLQQRKIITVATDETELISELSKIAKSSTRSAIPEVASSELISHISSVLATWSKS
jgi:UDP-N-acetylglucosamine transferase subunit ALG13